MTGNGTDAFDGDAAGGIGCCEGRGHDFISQRKRLFELCIACFEFHLDNFERQRNCMEKPACKDLLKGFDVPKIGSIWGWRLTKVK